MLLGEIAVRLDQRLAGGLEGCIGLQRGSLHLGRAIFRGIPSIGVNLRIDLSLLSP